MKLEWTESRVAAALERLEEFRGTRHIHRRAIPGIGVDCIHLVYEALKAGGVIDTVRIEPYARDAGWNLAAGKLEAHFMTAFRAIRIEPENRPANGDIAILRTGRVVNHCGIFFNGEIWHAQIGTGTYPNAPKEMLQAVHCYVRIEETGYKTT